MATSSENDRPRLSALRDDSKLRRKTFQDHWPGNKPFISVEELVREGFYCMGRGDDSVQCVFCRGIIKNWVQGDNVYTEHCRLFPLCPFCRYVFKFPQYCDLEDRFKTYTDWPSQLNQKPRQLSKAGFFYIGAGDKVQCFWCGTVLKDWEPSDDPVLEHLRWSPNCSWLLTLKGPKFVEEVKQEQAQSPKQAVAEPIESARLMGYSPEQIQQAVEKLGSEFDLSMLVDAIMSLDQIAAGEPREPDVIPSTSSGGSVPPSSPTSGAQITIKKDTSLEDLELPSLSKENFALKRRSECKICMEEDVSVVFMPCSHLVCCFSCASLLNVCPVCRKRIREKIRIFW